MCRSQGPEASFGGLGSLDSQDFAEMTPLSGTIKIFEPNLVQSSIIRLRTCRNVSNSHNLKIFKVAAAAILNFEKGHHLPNGRIFAPNLA